MSQKPSKAYLKYLCLIGSLTSLSMNGYADDIRASVQTATSIKKAKADGNQLIFATGIFDPKNQQLSFADTNINNVNSEKYGIVQFYDRKADFNWLNKNGFKVVQNLSNNAYIVNWQNMDKSILARNGNIRWHGSFKSGFKVSPNLWIKNRRNATSYQLSLTTFKDTKNFNLNGLLKKYLPHAKILNTNVPKGFNEYIIEVKASQVDEAINKLASIESIQWINHYYKEKFFNTEAVSAVQATSPSGGTAGDDNYIPMITPIWDQGIYGTGQIVGVADSGLDRNEDWFTNLDKGSGVVSAVTEAEDVLPPTIGNLSPDNKVIGYWVMPGAASYDHTSAGFHGTHVTGSVAGDRSQAIGAGPVGSISSPTSHGYDNDDGMAPNAQILFNDIGSDGGLTGAGSLPMWQQAFEAGAAIHTNSYGSSTLGQYVGSDQRADEALRELEDMIILFAAGNDDGLVNTTGSPGNSKNVTTVGALLHGNSASVAGFSNGGPTDDGRLKPDLSATGTAIESAAGDTSNTISVETPSRRTTSGTSMSTPITAGATALLRQYFTDGFYPTGMKNTADEHTPSGPLMKAVLLNGTNTDGGFFENRIGWGRVWLENSLYFDGESKKMRIWEITNANGLKTGEQFSTSVEVQAGEEFRATLVWYDLEGPTGSGVTLVNDLNLTVQQGANTYLGNNFTANNSVTTGSADSINTVEQIRFAAPVSGTYDITIDAANIPGNGTPDSDRQGFALVVSGNLSSGNAVPANPTPPSNLAAVSDGTNGINVSWTGSADYDNYEIYRTSGSCSNADLSTLRYVGNSSTTDFTDTDTIGGVEYSYKIRGFSDDLISEYTSCVDVVSEQICPLAPEFDQNTVKLAVNNAAFCEVTLTWQAATANCPLATGTKYNVYRSDTHGFTPDSNSLFATTELGALRFTDTTTVSGETYYYIVKAEDDTVNGTGPNNGNESENSNLREQPATPLGITTVESSLTDDVDNLATMRLGSIWSVSNEQSSNGNLSYRSAREGANTYTPDTCARMYSMPFTIPTAPAATPNLTYQARYDIESNWDGVVVEISTDNGTTWTDLPPDGGYPDNFSQTGSPPINICGYDASHGAFGGSTSGAFESVSHDLSAYQGQKVQIRWSLSTDPGSEEEGFYLDELQYNNINAPQSCAAFVDEIFSNDFEEMTIF